MIRRRAWPPALTRVAKPRSATIMSPSSSTPQASNSLSRFELWLSSGLGRWPGDGGMVAAVSEKGSTKIMARPPPSTNWSMA